MSRPLLYYITDRSQFPGDEPARRRQLREKIGEAVRAGVDYIQLREKDLCARELEALARETIGIIRNEGSDRSSLTKLLINSRTDIALAVGSDGVHLRSEDVSPADVRNIVRTTLPRNSNAETGNFVIAVSCHSETEVQSAAHAGSDFVVFAPVFEKRDNFAKHRAGLDALAKACHHDVPVFALGGVTLKNAPSCFEAGASGIAGIRLFQENVIAEVVRACGGEAPGRRTSADSPRE